VDTPGDPKAKLAAAMSTPLTTEEEKRATGEYLKQYKEIVGSLLYAATMTRPDIACVVGLLSRAMDAPREVHWLAATRVLRYLRGTLSLGLRYSGRVQLQGYTDANWGGDTFKTSTSGFLFFLNGGAISWGSRRQKATSISSCEAEYYAASCAVSEAIWLRLLCSELGMEIKKGTTLIWEDNQGCIQLSKGPSRRKVSKHIDIRHHFIRQHVADKEIALKYVKSKANVADALTKPLPRSAFLEHRNTMMGEKAKPYTYLHTGSMGHIEHEARDVAG